MSIEDLTAGVADRFAWVSNAPCVRHPVLRAQLEGFGERAPSPEALLLCQAPCRVRSACVSHAFDMGTDSGWYGGLSPSRRRKFETKEECLEWMASLGMLPRPPVRRQPR